MTLAAMLTLLLAQATAMPSPMPTWLLLHQQVTVKDIAATVDVEASGRDEFLILVQFQSSKFPVGCLSAYHDLQYELFDAKNHVVPLNRQSLEHHPPELSIAGHVVTGSTSHPCSGNAPGGIWTVRAFFSVLYSNLSPGKYTLRIIFAPGGLGQQASFAPIQIVIQQRESENGA